MFQCKIILDNEKATYHTDSNISGIFKCFCKQSIRVRSVKIRLDCIEWVRWRRCLNFVQYNNYNVVYTHEDTIFSAKRGVKTFEHGQFAYPFQIFLPRGLPSTYSHTHGKVFYLITGTVIPFIWNDFKDSYIVTVISPVEIYAITRSYQREKIYYSETKFTRCKYGREGKVVMQVRVPRIAFVPGEIVDITVYVRNESIEVVKSLKVKFSRRVKFKAEDPRNKCKKHVDKLLKFEKEGIGAFKEHTYNFRMHIPELLDIPNLYACTLIKVEFSLKVWCQMPLYIKNPAIEILPEMGHFFSG